MSDSEDSKAVERASTDVLLDHGFKWKYICPKCLKGYNQEGRFLSHVQQQRCTNEKQGMGELDNNFHEYLMALAGKRPFKCASCEKRFRNQSALRVHDRIHNGDKPYCCKFCGKRFSQYGNLQMHVSIHAGERPFTCEICNKSFTQAGNLNTHRRTHTGEKPYMCTLCGKAFPQLANVQCHLRTHDREMNLARSKSRSDYDDAKVFYEDQMISFEAFKEEKTNLQDQDELVANSLLEPFPKSSEFSGVLFGCGICDEVFNGVDPFREHCSNHQEHMDFTETDAKQCRLKELLWMN